MPAFELPKRNRRQKNADTNPIPFKETLDLLNEFYLSTLYSLTEFSNSCEKKLNNVTFRIQKLEISCEILERKLKSIDGLNLDQLVDTKMTTNAPNGPSASSAPNAPTAPNSANIPNTSTAPSTNGPVPGLDGLPPPPNAEHLPSSPQPAESNVMKTKDDPRLEPFFKYLRLGIPKESFGGKMISMGYDPDWLDFPDEPTPLGEYIPEEKEEEPESESASESGESNESDF